MDFLFFSLKSILPPVLVGYQKILIFFLEKEKVGTVFALYLVKEKVQISGGNDMNDLSLFNSLFDDFGDAYNLPSFSLKKAFYSPKVDVKEDDSNYTLEMDLPGKTDKDVKIELDRNVLTISSEAESAKEESSEDKKDKKAKDENKEKWLIKERTYTQFSRSFTVPDDVDSEKLTANVKNGVLTVVMPRHAPPSPRRIAINCA